MALKKRYLLSGVVAVLAFSSLARAQTVQPFVDPGYFDYDMQLFAPADDLDAYGGDPIQKYGWFGSYSRMYISVTRPVASQFAESVGLPSDVITYAPANAAAGTAAQQFRFGVNGIVSPQYNEAFSATYDLGDKTWGNRVDLGYMTDDNNGWLFSYMHIDGPNANQSTWQQRVNRINTADTGYTPPTSGSTTASTSVVEPDSDRNTVGPPDRERAYNITNSLNNAKLTSLELNKSFRMPPLNHGGIIEPFVGVRYMQFQDYTTRQAYDTNTQQYLTNAPPTTIDTGSTIIQNPDGSQTIVPNQPLVIAAPPGVTGAEALLSEYFQYNNNMFGGQLGCRWYRRLSRWNLSTDVRGFAMENFQHLSFTYDREYTFYSGNTQDATVTNIQRRSATVDDNATQIVLGTDIRASAAYEVTRDVQLDVGLQFLGFFNGIGRGTSMAHNDSDVMMVGLAFGFIWNR